LERSVQEIFDRDLAPAAGQSVAPAEHLFAEWSVSLPHFGATEPRRFLRFVSLDFKAANETICFPKITSPWLEGAEIATCTGGSDGWIF
jgi:hypothetical protein